MLDAIEYQTEKQAARGRRRRFIRAERAWRRARMRCFWTWPFGHRYETPDGQSATEAFRGCSSGGARPNLHCVGCGRGFGMFD